MFSDSKHIIQNSKYNCQLYWVSPCDFNKHYDTYICEAQFIIRNTSATYIYNHLITGHFIPKILMLNEACQILLSMDVIIHYFEFKNNILKLNTKANVSTLKFIENNNNLLSIHVHNVDGYYEFTFSI